MKTNQGQPDFTGIIEYYGFAPFEKVCLVTEDKKIYELSGKKELLDEIGKASGNRVIIYGKLQDNKIKVRFWDYQTDGDEQ